jgi:phage terminase Nu1 subunit (DNA packaging protein)
MSSSNPRGLPIQPRERFVSRKELAEIMGLSVRTIDHFVAEGIPSTTWGLRTRRFLPSQAVAWARERERSARLDGPR